ncbi:uncharacterized protein TNCV_2739401, partial [Trichonephila clavipes]
QFKRIHEDESIDDGDKFQYLIQATNPKSRARDIVESFPATPENYRKAFEYLKMRFGQEDVLIQVYVRELLKLVLQNTEIKKVNLSSLYDKIEAQLRALESLGVTKEKYAAMLFPLVESCLPSEILRAWERYVGYSSNESDPVETKTKLEIQKETLNHFQKTISVDISGRYEVALPWVLDNKLLSSNRKLAENRLERVREQDRDFLRFMWYDRENREHIKIYRHRRVVFGVTSSPFLLGATLNHHLDNAHGNFDNVAKILRKSFYVDNCVTSFETEEQLQKFIVESKILLTSAHFNLRGWQSNVLLNPENFSELESQPDNFETMVLGLIWNLKDDCLSCNINCRKNEGKAITKRSLLSIANHIFDPIGFTAPVTLKPKLILQEIWKLKLKWDENLQKIF